MELLQYQCCGYWISWSPDPCPDGCCCCVDLHILCCLCILELGLFTAYHSTSEGSSWSVLHHSGEYGVQKQAAISYVTNIILCHFHYGVTLWSQLKMMVARLLKFFFFTLAYNMHDYEFLSQFQYICTYKWCKSKLILIFIHDLDLEPHVFRYQLNMRNWVGMSHWVIWAQ